MKPNAAEKESQFAGKGSVLRQVWARPLRRCVSEAEHNAQKPRLAGKGRLASMAAGRNCYILAGEGFGKTRKFCPPCAALRQRQFAGQRFGFGAGFGSCVAGWLLRFWEMASGLGRERSSCSAKVVDVKRCRRVEVVGNYERLGKKSCLCWHNSNGRVTAVCQQTFGQHPPPYPAKSVGYGAGFNKFTLAGRPASGGQPA